jgi:hypothetical protein
MSTKSDMTKARPPRVEVLVGIHVRAVAPCHAARAAAPHSGGMGTLEIPGFRTQRRNVAGLTMNVATAGEGPPILLLHGFPRDLGIAGSRWQATIAAGSWRFARRSIGRM